MMIFFLPLIPPLSPNLPAFERFNVPGANLWKGKAIFIGIQIIAISLFIYKVRSMGLIPLTSADWVWLLPTKVPAERSSLLAPF